MRAWLKNPLGVPIWTVMGIILLCLFMGAAIPVFTSALGDRLTPLVGLPAVLLLGVLLIYDYKKLLLLILLFRAAGEGVLDSTKFNVGGTPVGIGALINLIVIMVAVARVVEKPKHFPRRLAGYWVPVLLTMALAMAISLEPGAAVKEYLTMLSNFAIFLIAVYSVRSNEDFNKVLRLVMWSSLIPTLYSLAEIALKMRDSSFRLQSTFTHPNVTAFYLTLLVIVGLYMLKSPQYKISARGRVGMSVYLPVLLAQLVLTQCRSAWVACFLVFVLYACFFDRKYLLYLFLLPLLMFIPAVSERVLDLGQGNEAIGYARLNSYAWRQVLWASALDWMEPKRMFFGYGLDGFGHYSPTFFPLDHVTKWDAHNVYVQFIFDTGVIGLLCYLWLYARVGLAMRALGRMDRVTGFLLLAVLVQYLVVSYSDNVFRYLVVNWYFWFTIGGACALAQLQPKPAPVNPGDPARRRRSHPAYSQNN